MRHTHHDLPPAMLDLSDLPPLYTVALESLLASCRADRRVKDQRIAELTADNASLRQQLTAAERRYSDLATEALSRR